MFRCAECGASSPKFEGRCVSCGGWGTLFDEEKEKTPVTGKIRKTGRTEEAQAHLVSEIQAADVERLTLSSAEINSVFGSGIPSSAAYLLSGEPGVGKSTLLLSMINGLSYKILYTSGEETIQQIRARMLRLDIKTPDLHLSSSTDTSALAALIRKSKFQLVLADSVQTLWHPEIDGTPGSLQQIRSASWALMDACRKSGAALMMTGHITKSGDIAGPKLLEHMVDGTFLMSAEDLEDSAFSLRVLRPIKNRFGSVDTSALFRMTAQGLTAVRREDLVERNRALFEAGKGAPGTVFYPHFIGRRLFFSEIEALTVGSAMGMPKRISEGISPARLSRLIAVLEKYTGIVLHDKDVYLNLGRGVKSEDVHMDLSIAAAIYASYRGLKIPPQFLFMGEVGLSGAVRPVGDLHSRSEEISRFGDFTPVLNTDEKHCRKVRHVGEMVTLLNEEAGAV